MWNTPIQFSLLTTIQDTSPIKDVLQKIGISDIQ